MNGREENTEQTRNRLKLIPKVGNLDEWAEKAPLTKTVIKFEIYLLKLILNKKGTCFGGEVQWEAVDDEAAARVFQWS